MLTVQPKIANYVNSKPVSFKALDDEMSQNDLRGENYYKEKVDYYSQQVREFENLAQDLTSPPPVRKTMKAFRVVSEALLEGWAVAWGASKGAKILKPSGKFAKNLKDILRPIYKGFKTSGQKIGEAFTGTVNKIKTSKFAEKLSGFVDKMRENSVGKYIVKGFEYIGKAFKYVGNLIVKGAKKLVEPFKGKTNGEIYDKASKVASTTLGVGAGAAGAYNAATDKKEKVATSSTLENDRFNEVDDEFENNDPEYFDENID